MTTKQNVSFQQNLNKETIPTFSLSDLSAIQRGEYFTVCCPKCGHKEAFLYIDDLKNHLKNPDFLVPIRCNRLNKCGETTLVKITESNVNKIEEKTKETKFAQDFLIKTTYLAQNVDLLTNYTLDWRGISNKTLKAQHVIYFEKGWDYWLKMSSKHVPQYMLKQEHYKNRDIIIPISNKSGVVERVLLRSSKKKLHPKELTVKLKDDASLIWNINDLYDENKKFIFITEGVVDGLSIKEINSDLGVISIPGVRNWKHILNEIETKPELMKEKTFVICFDNDKAGKEFAIQFTNELSKRNYKNTRLNLLNYKDLNECLNDDADTLSNLLNNAITQTSQKKLKRNIVH